jgi:DNA-binding NarL/FixJ family response regulator
VTDVLHDARHAYRRGDWPRAAELYTAARDFTALSADDASALGDAAWWIGRIDESNDALTEAYRRYRDQSASRQAAMCAVNLGVNHVLRGDSVLGSGWFSLAGRLLEDDHDSAEYGYLLFITGVEATFGDPRQTDSLAAARRVQELGRRHHDPNLVVAGIMGEGRILIGQGAPGRGVPMLDEALVLLLTEELEPAWAGDVYCNLMAAAHELVDVQRAAAWTEAAGRWLASLPAAVLFTGICRVHRAQVLQLRGSWEEAADEARRAGADLAGIQPATAAEAHYQLGEIHRLRGELPAAELCYAEAHRLGRDPQPGVALWHLADGSVGKATASVRAALMAEPDRLARARLSEAQVEIALAAGDEMTARKASEELTEIADLYGTSGLTIMATLARGSVLLAAGHAAEALPMLRDAHHRWLTADTPYDDARVRSLLARAYGALGDDDSADREAAAARAIFDRLGHPGSPAAAARTDRLPAGLTAREAEVLSLVAAGGTNRDVAAELVISEKTVARHLANIFAKLGVSSRTGASAFAFEHGLATRAGR